MRKRWQLINKLAKYQFRERFVLRWLLDLFELFLVVVSFVLAWLITSTITPSLGHALATSIYQFVFYLIFLVVFWYAISQVSFMANYPRAQRFLSAIMIFGRGYFFILMLLLLVRLIFSLNAIPVVLVLANAVFAFMLTLGFRIITMYFVRIYRAAGNNLRKIIIIGDGSAQFLVETFLKQKDWGFEIKAIISSSRKLKNKYGSEIPVLIGTQNLTRILENQVVDEVFFSQRKFEEAQLRSLGRICDEVGVVLRVHHPSTCLDPENFQLKTFNQNGGLALVDVPSRRFSYDFKAVTDIIFSFCGLLVLSPILLLIAMVIKLESKGPVFFKQERIGLRGRKFKLWKFRTMISNAEELQEKLKGLNEADGPAFKMKNDPRITRLGKIMRKTGIDEIPQLINVLKGEMSLIGPRPPVESEVKQYERWQLRRLSVKPGITCIWQVAPNRNDIKFEKWMQMDLNYIDNWSLKLDFKLVFKTIFSMLLATGR